MPKRRAQITRQTTDDMYGDVIDRVTAAMVHHVQEPPVPEKPPAPPLTKVTVYLRHEDVLAIDYLVSEEFRRTGKRPRRSKIVGRAIQGLLLLAKAAEGQGDGGDG
jgi:hypothetical protein